MFNRVQVSKQLSVSVKVFNQLSRSGLIPRGKHFLIAGVTHRVWSQEEVAHCKVVIDMLTTAGFLQR